MRKHNDYSYLIKDKDFHGTPISDKFTMSLHNTYLELLTEFFNEFGQTEASKDEIKIKEEILDLNLEFIRTGDTFILNDIAILEKKLLDKQASNIDKTLKVDTDLEDKQMIAKVSKSLPYPIDIRKISVLTFYTQLTIQETTL